MNYKNPYKVLPNYFLRVPSGSFELYKNITQLNKIKGSTFKNLLKNSLFINALHLASPELLEQFIKWNNNKLNNPKKVKQLEFSILKYLTRFTTRATPFGLFAGCSEGSFSNLTSINLELFNKKFNTFTRVDMSFLSVVIDNLSKEIEIKSKINYYPNSTLYKIDNQYRYTSFTYENNKRIYSLDGAVHSQFLENIINEAYRGKTIDQLALKLTSKEIKKNEAITYVQELIDKQILISELQLNITSNNNLLELIKRLESLSINEITLNSLKNLNNKITLLDKNKLTSYRGFYNWVVEEYKDIKHSKKNILQVDLLLDLKVNSLDNKHIKSIRKSMVILNKLTTARENNRLENFKKEFIKRYDNDELPLFKVLDTETGIGYSGKLDNNSPFLEDLYLPDKKNISKNINWNNIDSILLEKVVSCIHKKEYTLELKDSDFKNYESQWNDLPDTMSSIIEVVKLNGKEKLVINGFGGTSAANILARFSHGNNSILKQVNEIAKIEKKINLPKIIAEIIHLPQSRTGNILRRPSVRDYEIPFLGKSKLAKKNQIHLKDIFISIKKGKIILRSKHLNKEIIPRLTNAHNYTNGLPIYLFLCDLQLQNKRYGIKFKWNYIFEQFSFLPRVEYSSVIISKAQWNIKTEVMNNFMNLEGDYLIREIKAWRENLKMPDLVQLVNRDNLLLINMQNETCIKMFLDTIKSIKNFKLIEFLLEEEGVVKKENESFCNQFVVSIYNEHKLKNSSVENLN